MGWINNKRLHKKQSLEWSGLCGRSLLDRFHDNGMAISNDDDLVTIFIGETDLIIGIVSPITSLHFTNGDPMLDALAVGEQSDCAFLLHNRNFLHVEFDYQTETAEHMLTLICIYVNFGNRCNSIELYYVNEKGHSEFCDPSDD